MTPYFREWGGDVTDAVLPRQFEIIFKKYVDWLNQMFHKRRSVLCTCKIIHLFLFKLLNVKKKSDLNTSPR